ncbi:MAG: VWA domain-containing protein [Streptosporangiaceae bacterium]
MTVESTLTGGACPSCGQPVDAGDGFCEACGTELSPPVVSTGAPGYMPECPVCSVDPSSPPVGIIADGYCESCGRKAPTGRDHAELDLGALARVTDRGLRHRRNEDAIALAAAQTPSGPVAIAVVCDGVSNSPNIPSSTDISGEVKRRVLPCLKGRSLHAAILMTQSGFTVDVDQNQYLPEGGRDVSAIVTVTFSGDAAGIPAAAASAPASAEIIIIDCSGSMEYPHTKIAEARAATAAAIDVVRDGVWFSVIAGTNTAWPVFPPDGSMAIADPGSRAAARQAVTGLRASGGTAIGQWLSLARQIFGAYPARLRHAILLTDGKNQHETPDQLLAALRECEGVFSCDCRGVGTDWEVGELRTISTALLGTVDIVPDPSGLAADFAAMMRSAMGKQVADVALRVWTPQHATVRFVKQVAPAVDDLTARRTPSGPQAGDYPTGAWGPGESRDYHIGVEVNPAGVGQEMLAARVSLVAGPPSAAEVLGQGLVRAIWTDDEALSTKINPLVAHYTGQAELADAIQEGLEARKQGAEEAATANLGRAVALAHQSGNEDTAKLLAKVVDVVDVETGTVRLKKAVEDVDEMALDTRSTKTVRVKKAQS